MTSGIILTLCRNADAGMIQLTIGITSDAGTNFFRHLLLIFQQHLERIHQQQQSVSIPLPAVWTSTVILSPPTVWTNGHAGCIIFHRQQNRPAGCIHFHRQHVSVGCTPLHHQQYGLAGVLFPLQVWVVSRSIACIANVEVVCIPFT